jgi:hypothetical protein
LALAEAYGITGNPTIRKSLEACVQAALAAQAITKPEQHQGGWRYSMTATDSDTSVSGWMIMGLKSAKLAGIEVPEAALKQAANYLWQVYKENKESAGFGYSSPGVTPSMTGVGVLCQQFLGNASDPRLNKALNYLRTQKLTWGEGGQWSLYGWYYITQAMFHSGGQNWAYWDGHFSKALVDNQNQDGSWNAPPKSNESGHGIVYSTALSCLMLEVYYRYLPIYNKH